MENCPHCETVWYTRPSCLLHVMRRALGTDMQKHGTMKDTQSMLRHASLQTTGDVNVHSIEQSVLDAVISRTAPVLIRLNSGG